MGSVVATDGHIRLVYSTFEYYCHLCVMDIKIDFINMLGTFCQ